MSYLKFRRSSHFLISCLTWCWKAKLVMTDVHINSNVKAPLFRVKTFKGTISHFCNVDSDLLSNFIKNFPYKLLANLNFLRNSGEIKLLWLPVSKRIADFSDFVLNKLLTIAILSKILLKFGTSFEDLILGNCENLFYQSTNHYLNITVLLFLNDQFFIVLSV